MKKWAILAGSVFVAVACTATMKSVLNSLTEDHSTRKTSAYVSAVNLKAAIVPENVPQASSSASVSTSVPCANGQPRDAAGVCMVPAKCPKMCTMDGPSTNTDRCFNYFDGSTIDQLTVQQTWFGLPCVSTY